ncbi:MerR family transcriptional regulator [Streptomyces sp. WMMC940]|uniref:MerR family transcriptional regulator n=1 Tax=Streptomyces sp. WMMC940 TaxID=3015153 RepID=UPI0022B69042|nr:MerR family transcriptional regulator [Streptomyces sp. WMMC940]MCZ7458936.1 MerR family transcriptional regulator [Streptomyces sp. WMMC940]
MNDPRTTRGKRVPTSLAALALGVREGTIRQWARRGKITRYGTRRQALYDLDELATLAAGDDGGGRAAAACPRGA